jgi:hypothetical protein
VSPQVIPVQPTCTHADRARGIPTCAAFLVAPRCRCGGELQNPCSVPTQGETRGCALGLCWGRYEFYGRTWWPVGKLPEQWKPERVRVLPRHLRSVA